jgi:hypothetical protein
MIEWDLVGRCMRRWYVVVLGVVLTTVAVANVSLLPGVHWARAHVLLLGPPSAMRPNKLDSGSAGLIATAGLIEREMNTGVRRIPATSNEVTLVDQGIYDGEQVHVPDNGGQWANNFDQPVLDVQASGPTSAIVEQRIEAMVHQIEEILRRRQDDAGVSPANRITVASSPRVTHVYYARGDRNRAVLLTTTLGLWLTLWSVIFVDRRLAARRSGNRSRPRPVPMKSIPA